MPPKNEANVLKKDGDTAVKKVRKRVLKKDRESCPSRIRKTDRVVLNSQARDIIRKVYYFMKKEAVAEYAERLTNARWRTATAAGVSEKTVSRILKTVKKKAGSTAAEEGSTNTIPTRNECGDLKHSIFDYQEVPLLCGVD